MEGIESTSPWLEIEHSSHWAKQAACLPPLLSLMKAGSHDPIFRANFVLKLREVSVANQHFYELKRWQKIIGSKKWTVWNDHKCFYRSLNVRRSCQHYVIPPNSIVYLKTGCFKHVWNAFFRHGSPGMSFRYFTRSKFQQAFSQPSSMCHFPSRLHGLDPPFYLPLYNSLNKNHPVAKCRAKSK